MTVYKRPNSIYYQCEFEYKGKRYRESTETTSKVDAQAYEVRRRKEVREDFENARRGIQRSTLFEVATSWLEATEATHRNHKHDQSRVRKLFGCELVKEGDEWVEKEGARAGLPKTLQVHELTQAHMLQLKRARTAEGNTGSTINREMSLVQSLLGYAQSIGVVMPTEAIVWSQKRNKAASLKSPEGKGKLRWLRLEEERRLLEALKPERENDKALVDAYHLSVLLLDTGARYNEIATLRWAQVELDTGRIDLFRSKVQNESRPRIPERSLQILVKRRAMLSHLRVSYVFPQLKGKNWSGEDLPRGHATGSIQRTIDACGLNDDPSQDKVTPHTFRDTYASRLVQAGVSLLKVQTLLGHSDPSMTQKYAHLCPDAAGAEAAAILDGIHGNKTSQGDGPMRVTATEGN